MIKHTFKFGDSYAIKLTMGVLICIFNRALGSLVRLVRMCLG